MPEGAKWHHVASVGDQDFAFDVGHGGSALFIYMLNNKSPFAVGQFETFPVKHLWEGVRVPLNGGVLCTEAADLLDVIVY